MRTFLILLAAPLLIYFSAPRSESHFRDVQSETASDAKVQTQPAIIEYQGWLEAGKTYRATVRGDRLFGLSLEPRIRMAPHQAVLVEWTNLGEFPTLKRLRRNSRKRQIVFSVVTDESRRMTEWRWNRTVSCKILRVE